MVQLYKGYGLGDEIGKQVVSQLEEMQSALPTIEEIEAELQSEVGDGGDEP